MTETVVEHPFTRPEGSDVDMFIQWKGCLDVCLDFTCPCGTWSHFDGEAPYFLRCPTCGAIYEMGTQVIAKRVDDPGSGVQDLTDPVHSGVAAEALEWSEATFEASVENWPEV